MKPSSIILSHSGKQHSYYVAKALLDLGYLKQFVTSSYVASPLLQKLIQVSKMTYLTRRFHAGLTAPYVDANWRFEFKEQVMRTLKGNTSAVNDLVIDRDISFDRALSKRLKRLNFETFWGFQGSCLQCLTTANEMNKETVCEMTSVYLPTAKAILEEEAKLQPEWADSIVFSSFPSDYEARLIEEPQAAKHVIAISQFLKTTLIQGGIDEKKIAVVPLGFDASAIKFNTATTSLRNRALRLLFVGRITQGKGIKYLLEAMKEFDKRDVELHIIGNIYGSGAALSSYKNQYTYTAGVSQQTLFNLYGNYDVLVLPSILEGFGLVTLEAMGAGLPVITTPNTNATELVNDGLNGFIVPIRNIPSIVQSIRKFRDMPDEAFQKMRYESRASALKYTWAVHKQEVERFVKLLD